MPNDARATVFIAATGLVCGFAMVEAQHNDGYAQSGQMVAAAFRLMDAAYLEAREFGKLEIRGNLFGGRRLREFGLQLTAGEFDDANERPDEGRLVPRKLHILLC